MKQATLGTLEVGVIGLGCMSMTGTYGPADPEESEATLLRAIELGVTLFDTANAYGLGENERLVGRVLAPFIHEIVLSTKFGFVQREGRPAIDGRPEQVEERCNESLRRLAVDTIDLYFLHRPDPEVPIEDTVGAMARLVEKGKVRHLGLSEVSARTLKRAHSVHPITAVQSEYSLWTRDPEAEVLPMCRQLGIGFMPFSPVGRAILTGRLSSQSTFEKGNDMRAGMPRFHGENLQANLDLVTKLKEIATEANATPAQVALAWLCAKGADIAPIPGTKRRGYLEENVAAQSVSLSPESILLLDEFFAPDKVAGARYGQRWMQSQDTVAAKRVAKPSHE